MMTEPYTSTETDTIGKLIESLTPDRRELGLAMDGLVSEFYCTSCMEAECEYAWELVVAYLTGDDRISYGLFNPALAEEVIALARRTGGFWARGCAYSVYAPEERDADRDEEDRYDLAAHPSTVGLPVWVTLQQMAELTGKTLPPAGE